MDGIVMPGDQRGDSLREQAMALHDRPAFVARAQRAVLAEQMLMRECRVMREEMLAVARVRLGILRAQAGEWGKLCMLLELSSTEREVFEQLEEALSPELRVQVQPTTSPRRLQATLNQLRESLTRFNQRWQEWLGQVDFTNANVLREKYNRYYVFEKECATRSFLAAQTEFVPMPPLTLELLFERFPLLTVP